MRTLKELFNTDGRSVDVVGCECPEGEWDNSEVVQMFAGAVFQHENMSVYRE